MEYRDFHMGKPRCNVLVESWENLVVRSTKQNLTFLQCMGKPRNNVLVESWENIVSDYQEYLNLSKPQ